MVRQPPISATGGADGSRAAVGGPPSHYAFDRPIPGAAGAEAATGLTCIGLPPFEPGRRAISIFERLHKALIYLPVAFLWLLLAIRHGSPTLPMLANPLLEGGGMVGDRKSALFDAMSAAARSWLATFVAVERIGDAGRNCDDAVARMTAARLSFPVVAKPDIGGRGVGVRPIPDAIALRTYIDEFPPGGRFLLQRYVDYEGEAGIFYVRHPPEPRGRISSLTFKYAPIVTGDGRSTLRDLVRRDPRARHFATVYEPRLAEQLDSRLPAGKRICLTFARNHARGGICRNGDLYITAELENRFDEIARAIPEFYAGRFDVLFASVADLQRGEKFAILEVNGVIAEPLNIWDADLGLFDAYRILLRQTALLFEIGRANRRRGFAPPGVAAMRRLYRRRNHLVRRYPPGL